MFQWLTPQPQISHTYNYYKPKHPTQYRDSKFRNTESSLKLKPSHSQRSSLNKNTHDARSSCFSPNNFAATAMLQERA